jgi:hypothetical protein
MTSQNAELPEGLKVAVGAALHRRLTLARAHPHQAWDDEMIATVVQAAVRYADQQVAGCIENVSRTDGAAGVAIDILGRFTRTDQGYSARVGQVQIGRWRERLGLPAEAEPPPPKRRARTRT